MNSRDKILAAVKNNQPQKIDLPDASAMKPLQFDNAIEQFCKVLENIGGSVVSIQNHADITSYVREHYNLAHKLLTGIEGIEGLEMVNDNIDPHDLEVVELAVLPAVFGVAENGAVWLSEKEMHIRVLPFIVQHLGVVLDARQLVSNMHEAYERLGGQQYGFGAFIAGPSKTADIEQSLVLGAHGPRSMTVFLLTGA